MQEAALLSEVWQQVLGLTSTHCTRHTVWSGSLLHSFTWLHTLHTVGHMVGHCVCIHTGAHGWPHCTYTVCITHCTLQCTLFGLGTWLATVCVHSGAQAHGWPPSAADPAPVKPQLLSPSHPPTISPQKYKYIFKYKYIWQIQIPWLLIQPLYNLNKSGINFSSEISWSGLDQNFIFQGLLLFNTWRWSYQVLCID